MIVRTVRATPPSLLPFLLPVLTLTLLFTSPAAAQQNPHGLVLPKTSAVPDAVQLAPLGATKLQGLLGERFDRNRTGRLLTIDENVLLDGFRKRPGTHDWIGEHVGKWLHAATLVWANTGDNVLQEKMNRVLTALLPTQEPDGYLGTYLPANRMSIVRPFAWDVWVHKYVLIGLLSAKQFTGDDRYLETAKKAGDLMVATFGNAPGTTKSKDINLAGEHVGMAATSVLEPMVLLYRATGDSRYLDFAKTVAAAWETTHGAHITSALKQTGCVHHVGNAKAYEMLSNFIGLVELYRATGDKSYLDTVTAAWEDIAAHHLYITGSGSSHERWLPHCRHPHGPKDDIGEVCVTVSWMQLNMHLYRLLGEMKYIDQMERSVYNHLLGAQRPSGDQSCYYTPLVGKKPYSPDLTCCFSSLTRGIALLPELPYAASIAAGDAESIWVNAFVAGESRMPMPKTGSVVLTQETSGTVGETTTIKLAPDVPHTFELRVRIPRWARSASVAVNDEPTSAASPGEYVSLRREWKAGDRVTANLDVVPVPIVDDCDTSGRMAVMYGPLVLAADEASNPSLGPIADLALDTSSTQPLPLRPLTTGLSPTWETAAVKPDGQKAPLILEPFYSAGADDSPIAVWFRMAGAPAVSSPSSPSVAVNNPQSEIRNPQ